MKESRMYVSSYKNNKVAKRSKIIFSRLIDYFSVVIVSFILFICCTSLINNSLPVVKQAYNDINTLNTELKKVVGETRIQEYDSKEDTLEDISYSYTKYLTSLVKTSFYLNNEKYPVINDKGEYDLTEVSKDETFLNVGEKDELDHYSYPNDNLSYFFLTFKSEEESLNDYVYEEVDYSSSKEDYLYRKMLGLDSETTSDYFISESEFSSLLNKENLNRYNVLTLKTSKALMNYLVYEDETSVTIYSNLSNCYYNASSKGVSQVEENYTKYIELNKKFIPSYNTYVLSVILSYVAAFILGYVVVYLVIPPISKKKNTLGMKVFKLGIVRSDEMEPRWSNNLIELVMLFITDFSSIFFGMFFLNQLSISSYSFNGGINFFSILMFSLGLDLLSIVFFFINKNHQLLSNFASFTLIKDTEEFEDMPASDEKLEERKKDA